MHHLILNDAFKPKSNATHDVKHFFNKLFDFGLNVAFNSVVDRFRKDGRLLATFTSK